VALQIYDPAKSKLVVYHSTADFNLEKITELVDGPISRNNFYEKYSNDDYQPLADSKVVTAELRKRRNTNNNGGV